MTYRIIGPRWRCHGTSLADDSRFMLDFAGFEQGCSRCGASGQTDFLVALWI